MVEPKSITADDIQRERRFQKRIADNKAGRSMKALTISQPFPSLIADLLKWIENRSWYTDYRGPLAIHAGKGTQYMTRKELQEVPHGCVLAVADLVACVRISEIREKGADPSSRHLLIPGTNRTWAEAAAHEHAEGPWCLILENVQKLALPIPATGRERIWNWEPPSSHGETLEIVKQVVVGNSIAEATAAAKQMAGE